MRRRTVGGDEMDGLTWVYRYFSWRPGARAALKRKCNKRERREGKAECREQTNGA